MRWARMRACACVNSDVFCFSSFLLMNSICLQPQGKLVTRNFLLSFQLRDFTTTEPLQHSDKQAEGGNSGELRLLFFTI